MSPASEHAVAVGNGQGRLRFAVIGAGWWATLAHLPALMAHPEADLIAVVDIDPARRRSAMATFGIPFGYPSLEKLLNEHEIDAVVVSTPHTSHFDIASSALDRGVHVLVEKPLTTTAEDAWALVRAARDRGLELSVAATYHYTKTALAVRQAVQHQIGELVAVNAEFSSSTAQLYAVTDPAQANMDAPGLPHGTTYSDPALSGGGQGQTQLTHILGCLLWITEREATDVAAFMDTRGLAVDAVDSLTFRLTGGVLGAATSAATTPSRAPIRHQLRFHGTEGLVEYDMLHADAWLYRADGTALHFENPVNEPPYPWAGPAQGFVDLLRGRAENVAPAGLAAAAVSMISAAYESARTGRIVAVQQRHLEELESSRTEGDRGDNH